MAIYYDKTISYSGETFTLRVDMRTGTTTVGDQEVPTNTVSITHYDGTTDERAGVLDGDILRSLTTMEQAERELINGVPNQDVDNELIQAGYTRH